MKQVDYIYNKTNTYVVSVSQVIAAFQLFTELIDTTDGNIVDIGYILSTFEEELRTDPVTTVSLARRILAYATLIYEDEVIRETVLADTRGLADINQKLWRAIATTPLMPSETNLEGQSQERFVMAEFRAALLSS